MFKIYFFPYQTREYVVELNLSGALVDSPEIYYFRCPRLWRYQEGCLKNEPKMNNSHSRSRSEPPMEAGFKLRTGTLYRGRQREGVKNDPRKAEKRSVALIV